MQKIERHEMLNKDLAVLIKRTPLKLRSRVCGQEQFFNLEKKDFTMALLENPDQTHWEVCVDRGAVWVYAIPY